MSTVRPPRTFLRCKICSDVACITQLRLRSTLDHKLCREIIRIYTAYFTHMCYLHDKLNNSYFNSDLSYENVRCLPSPSDDCNTSVKLVTNVLQQCLFLFNPRNTFLIKLFKLIHLSDKCYFLLPDEYRSFFSRDIFLSRISIMFSYKYFFLKEVDVRKLTDVNPLCLSLYELCRTEFIDAFSLWLLDRFSPESDIHWKMIPAKVYELFQIYREYLDMDCCFVDPAEYIGLNRDIVPLHMLQQGQGSSFVYEWVTVNRFAVQDILARIETFSFDGDILSLHPDRLYHVALALRYAETLYRFLGRTFPSCMC